MTWDADLRAEDAAGIVIALVTITHSDLASPIRLSPDPTERISDDPLAYRTLSRGLSFDFLPMGISLPKQQPDAPPTARLVVDNIDFAMVRAIEELDSDEFPKIGFEIVHSSDLDDVIEPHPNFLATSWSHDNASIEFALGFDGGVRGRYPFDTYSRAAFPGLFL